MRVNRWPHSSSIVHFPLPSPMVHLVRPIEQLPLVLVVDSASIDECFVVRIRVMVELVNHVFVYVFLVFSVA